MHKPSQSMLKPLRLSHDADGRTDGRTDGFSALYSRLADVPALSCRSRRCYNGIELYIALLNMLHSRLFKETTTAATPEH